MHTPEDPHSIRELRQWFSTAGREKRSHEAAHQLQVPGSQGVPHFDGAKHRKRLLNPGGGREPSLPQQKIYGSGLCIACQIKALVQLIGFWPLASPE